MNRHGGVIKMVERRVRFWRDLTQLLTIAVMIFVASVLILSPAAVVRGEAETVQTKILGCFGIVFWLGVINIYVTNT